MNWTRVSWTIAALLPVIALLAYGMTLDARALPSTMPGRAAPEFALTIMESQGSAGGEQQAHLAAHRGEVVVLNFWASWCLACRSEHAALSRVAARYWGQGVQFYGVLYNDTPPNAARYIRELGGQTYPTLLDPGSRTAIDYGLHGVPETFFIGPDGVVVHKHIGPITERQLVEWIETARQRAHAAPEAAPVEDEEEDGA
jgi:cytochrome c biogenesis protein CcmG, thiol:disulfide interchange protein DsbE